MKTALTGLTLWGTVSLSLVSVTADDRRRDDQQGELSSQASQLAELDLAIKEQWKTFDDEGREPALDPLIVFGDQLASIALEDASLKRSLLATDFLLRYGHGVKGDASHKLMMEGMRAALLRQKDNAELVAVLEHVGNGGTPEREIEDFLQNLLGESTNATVRAGTAFALAKHLDNMAQVRHHLDEYITRLRSAFPEHGPQLDDLNEYLSDRDSTELRREAANLLRMIIQTYPDELPFVRHDVTRWSFDARFAQDSNHPTYGTRADRLLFAVEHLREGCTVPEIIGEDQTGQAFRLSDYRGKVVLLMFSFSSCAACRGYYPINRALVEHFGDETFAVLGVWSAVGANDTLEELQKSVDGGDITWRCWWDDLDMPIATSWDVQHWPLVYLINDRGIIHQQYPQRDLESLKKTISELLEEIDDESETES